MAGDPHCRHLLVWDVPAAVECGKSFRVRVGVKCTEACGPGGWSVALKDHEQRLLAAAELAAEPWPGTDALHVAEVELSAPQCEGFYAWEAVAPAVAAAAGGVGHAETATGFNVRAVPAAACRLRVVAVERSSQAPVSNARVVVYPYRARTDEHGIAELRLPKGQYRLFVTGRDFFPFRSDGTLDSDATVRAELEVDRGPSDAEIWS